MSFFKKLFGSQKNTQKSTPTEDKAFTEFFEDTLSRYLQDPEREMEFEFTAPDGTILPPSVAFVGAYEEWKNIQSVWDQRSVLYRSLDEKYAQILEKWQFLERFIVDRYPATGVKLVQEKATDKDMEDVEFLTSTARCYFFLSDYETAHEYILKALKIDSKHKRARIALADILHLKGEHEESHKLYHEILEESDIKKIEDNGEIYLLDIVSFHGQQLHSSVYAVSLLSDERIEEDMWNAVAEEFYHCPYFRTQHAYWLLNNGENLKGVAKLLTTSQEFPEHKPAVINAHSTILQIREQMNTTDLWEEDVQRLTKIIEKRGWEFAE
ncbi:hypothetical protein EZY14_011145 [Kordia sp. TARA_039_SRF]|nr:hypothetical protein EZY14_011145 [Kordia sp. TARA_039_SRF]